MRRSVASFGAIAAFSLMLVGTSKNPVGTPAGTTAAPPVPTVAKPTSLAVPSSAGWTVMPLPKAKMQIALPKDWSAVDSPYPDTAVLVLFNGTILKGDPTDVPFAKPSAPISKYVHAMTAVWERQGASLVLRAADAVVAHNQMPGALGHSVEVVACGTAGSREYCCLLIGSQERDSALPPVTDEQALQLVAVARSIAATP